jgi:hypothetical protein
VKETVIARNAAKEGKLEQQRGRKGDKKEKKKRRARGRNMKGSDCNTERREAREKMYSKYKGGGGQG